jgi:hypothetical protein
MKISIEDYFGNEVLILEYKQLKTTKPLGVVIEVVAVELGYNVADFYLDEDDNEYIRLQEVNVDNTEADGRENLINLIKVLNENLL